jgi:hypothetical protein
MKTEYIAYIAKAPYQYKYSHGSLIDVEELLDVILKTSASGNDE